MSKYINSKNLNFASKTSNYISLAYDGLDIYNGYVADGNTIGYNTTKTTVRAATTYALGAVMGKYGAVCGLYLGGPFGGIVGGISGGICGSLIGSFASDSMVDYIYNNY